MKSKEKESKPKVAGETYPEGHPVSMKERGASMKDICRHHGVTVVGKVIHLMSLTEEDLVACLTLGKPVAPKAWEIITRDGLVSQLQGKIKLAIPLILDRGFSEEVCSGLRGSSGNTQEAEAV